MKHSPAKHSDEEAAAALVAVFIAYRVVTDDMDRQLRAACGLSGAQAEVLVLLSRAPEGRLRMADIAAHACVSRSSVTQIVDKLVNDGHVVRSAAETDRRVIYAQITPAGMTTADLTRPVFLAQAQKHLGSVLTQDELAQLTAVLQRVAAR